MVRYARTSDKHEYDQSGISPLFLAWLTVPQLGHIGLSFDKGMIVYPATQACQILPQVVSHNSGLSDVPIPTVYRCVS